MTARGIRLNNPGNIRKGKDVWSGESSLQDDPDFVRFNDPAHGLRAVMKILLRYQDHYELEHIRAIISRWAPAVENETAAYIADVAARVGVKPDDYISLDIPENLIRVAQAISRHENGTCPDPTLPWWYPDEVYEEAAQMAMGIHPVAFS